MVPLPGHTAGHAGVAIQNGNKWLFHAGDAYLHSDEMQQPPCCPPGLAVYERIMDADRAARLVNQERLRVLKRGLGSQLQLFCSHDTGEFLALRGAA